MGRRLYVGNLPYSATEDQLTELFGRAGKVDNVRVMRDMATGRARGFAFVEMASDEDAQKAISEFHEQQMEGRALVVNEARPKPEGGFGGAGGGRGRGGLRRWRRWPRLRRRRLLRRSPQGTALVGRLFKMQERRSRGEGFCTASRAFLFRVRLHPTRSADRAAAASALEFTPDSGEFRAYASTTQPSRSWMIRLP